VPSPYNEHQEIGLIDLEWVGRPSRIGTWRVDDVLIDCGPATTVQTLYERLGARAPRALLLTHIHLDHAGAAGDLVKRWPDLPVFVHRKGARHLVDPERLIASARRVFGADFDLFGDMIPIPPENVRALDGGESVDGFRVAATPGHASHHVSYLHEASGRAFVGDVAAVRLGDRLPVLPPTPPPDIDIARWLESIEIVRSWRPVDLGLTHFDAVSAVDQHLDAVADALGRHADLARRLDEPTYVEAIVSELSAALTSTAWVDDYRRVVPLESNYAGLRRALESPRP
jgi:glyoxylase-like metal-dependent hydrolase (beta-lactamase superfamily II)